MAISARVRPTVFADEPTYSWLLRWADMSGFPSGRSMSTSVGVLFETAISGRANARIAAEAGLPLDIFDPSTFERMDQTTRCVTEILPKYDWNPNVLKLCPRCIEEDMGVSGRPGEATPHIRSWWMLFHVTACPFHNIRLVNQNSEGARFHAHPMRLLRDCDPRGPLSLADLPCHDVAETVAEHYVLGRIGFAPLIRVPLLDAMPLSNAVRLMDRMGAVAIGGRRAYTHGEGLDQNAALNRGFRLFENDGEGFAVLLDHLNDTVKRKRASWGAAEVYGRAYQWLNEERNDPVYAPVIEMMKEHAHAHIAISPDVPFFGELIGKRKLYRLPHLYEASGVHMDKARKIMVALGEITPEVTDPLIPRKRALRIIELLKSSMTYNHARVFLGMPRGAMLNLFDEGFVQPGLRAGTEGLQEHLFFREDLEKLVLRCQGASPAVFESRPRGCGDVVEAGMRSSSSAGAVLRLLQSGLITSKGILAGRTGLGAVMVDWEEARRALPPRPREIMTVVEAAKFLGGSFYGVRELLRQGFLRPTKFRERERKATRAVYVSLDEAKGFQEKFTPAQDVARALGTHVRVLVPKLSSQGIEPAIGNDVAGRYYYAAGHVAHLLARGS